eukprot:UN21350
MTIFKSCELVKHGLVYQPLYSQRHNRLSKSGGKVL